MFADTIIKSKLNTELDTPKQDPITKYVTLIPTTQKIDDLQKNIDVKSYTLNHTSVERG